MLLRSNRKRAFKSASHHHTSLNHMPSFIFIAAIILFGASLSTSTLLAIHSTRRHLHLPSAFDSFLSSKGIIIRC